MKKTILLVGVAVLLFSVTAGISYFLNNENQVQAKAGQAGKSTQDPLDRGEASDDSGKIPEGPLFTIPGPNPPVTEIAQLLQQLNAEKLKLESKRRALEVRHKQINISTQDMKNQQQTLNQVKDEVDQLLKEVRLLLKELEAKVAGITDRQTLIDRDLRELGKLKFADMKALKAQAKQFESMDAEVASNILGTLIVNGQTDEAARILAVMNDRSGGDILAAIGEKDPKTGADLVNRILQARQVLNQQNTSTNN